MKTIKQKLYRTKRVKHLEKHLNVAAHIYNHCIALQKRYYKSYGKYISKARMQSFVAKLKRNKYKHWKSLNSQTVQNIVERIDFGYQKFFKKENKRPPTFRKRVNYKSLTYKQSGWKSSGNEVTIQGVKFKFHKSREIENIRCLTLKKDTVGDWYVCFMVKVEDEVEVEKRDMTGETAGLDFGLKAFLTFDDGTEVQSPLFYKKNSDLIKKLSRKLSNKKKGSNNRKRARLDLARCHRKVSNQRSDHHFKLAKELALTYDEIYIEDLNMKAMQKLWGRKVSDLGFSSFVCILEHQCKKHGSKLIKIDRFYPSSKTCNECGYINKELTLQDREWICPECNLCLDRDVNAAKNIKRVGASTCAGDHVRLALASNDC